LIRSWQEIRNHYTSLAGAGDSIGAILKLIDEIESSPYNVGLFAWTSMHDLYIVQTPVEYPYNGPYLRISPIKNGELEFRYIDTTIEEQQWHRVVDGTNGFDRLERFIKQLHWFG
jgi:hypothetical protein